jgi:hypothetical protein
VWDTLFASRMRLRDPQHNGWSLAHYLPFVYYYLVDIQFATGTGATSRKGKVKNRALYEPNAKSAAPNSCPLATRHKS